MNACMYPQKRFFGTHLEESVATKVPANAANIA
jgi:hypothetical protein